MDDLPLNRLADAAGIEPRYWDIHGRLHERSPETARHLLGAMGIPAATDAEIAASLAMLAEEPWRDVLPPVIIATEGRDVEVPIRLPMKVSTRSLRWSVARETGELESGECALETLAVEAIGESDRSPAALRRLRLPAQPLGYHHLRLETTGETAVGLIVAPLRCHLPPDHERRKCWGIAAQLYALRSGKNWGVGDFGDLHTLVDWSAARGAEAIALNPLHALFMDSPQDCSPYSPSSRLFLNPLYLDVTMVPDFVESGEARAFVEASATAGAIEAARKAALVDYPAIARTKLATLELVYRHFRTRHANKADGRGRAFRDFIEERGGDLGGFATFQALSEHFGVHDWMRWPESCRRPESSEVAEFALGREQRVSFFQYLQWQCEEQLAAAAERARSKGLQLGLLGDLAVSVDAASADHWANQGLFVRDARVGAPPDPFNEAGQEWGVVPLDPRQLRATGYAHYISLLRANMRHMGALRIDHVMGWQRQFFVPAGGSPADGAYVRFPLDDLLAIAALESRRNKCLLIGEDLGTVPAGFRERMASADVLSCRVLYFEREHDRVRRPSEFPELASVSVATHDLATLRGYWTEEDVAVRARLGMFKSPEEERQARIGRARDKALLLQALGEEGLLSDEAGTAAPGRLEWTPKLSAAIHIYLARSRSRLLMLQLDDLSNEQQQANLPGNAIGYPNWRKRLDRSLEDLMTDHDIRDAMATIVRERRR
jgi:(1->4)-alpha-D-glucan 1-alpha-D-glucosylmutase